MRKHLQEPWNNVMHHAQGDTFNRDLLTGNGEKSVSAGVDLNTSYEEQLRSIVTELMGSHENQSIPETT